MHSVVHELRSIVRPLPKNVRTSDVADSCRYAALAFLNGVLGAWGKTELGAWLGGPYADVTRYGRDEISEAARLPGAPRREAKAIAPYTITRVMRESREEALETLRLLAEPDGGVNFGFDALDGLVLRCRDASGQEGWLPTSPRRRRLADRVLSLIAVDYLARPEDYEQRLAICSRCGVLSFDAAARARGVCRVHSASGVRFKSNAPPLPVEVDEEATLVGLGRYSA